MFKRLINFPFYSPDDAVGTGGGGKDTSKEDIIDFLGDDDDDDTIKLDGDKKNDKESKDRKESKSKSDSKSDNGDGKDNNRDSKDNDGDEDSESSDEDKESEDDEEEEEDDELKDIEDELEEPTDEQLELVTPVRRREILKAYPDLFKKFPYLEKAYYREQQFTELLPTIDDAKQAVEAKDTLDKFERDLSNGNTETILRAVKSENPKGFNKIVDDYMVTLSKVDSDAYHHVIGNTIKHTIMAMVTEARSSKNEALSNAAAILNQFVFSSSDFKPPEKLSSDDSEKDDGREKELKLREQTFIKRQFETSRNDLNSRVNNSLKNTIDANIDPKSSMTDYVRKNASREALETLETIIGKDTRFKVLIDKLWEKAFSDDFSKSSVDRIKSAYFSKAKTLLPSVIKKARNEALRGIGKRVSSDKDSDNEEKEVKSNKGPVTSGRPRSNNPSGKITKGSDIPRGMRTIDFLMQD